jgi:hypothetical protein
MTLGILSRQYNGTSLLFCIRKCYVIIYFLFPTTSIAQSLVFRSIDFEKPNVNEYIYLNHNGELVCQYWTNQNDMKVIDLLVEYDKEGTVVQFPNNKEKYYLREQDNMLICKHPDGKRQTFYQLPEVYSSRNFEKTEVTEYIQIDQWLYFTSEDIHKKIPLQVVWDHDGEQPLFFKFPGDNNLYEYDYPASCERAFVIEYPDGRQQIFRYDPWYFVEE